jgi:hypothetical protein
MLNKIATSNRVRGKGLKLKRFSGKFCVLVCASFLISVSTQATHPEFEDWSFDQDGNFYTSTGQQIKPWDQPQALRQARNVGPDEVQALLDNSALRIVQCDNGDFVLHLHGRLRGRGGGQSTSRGDGGNGGSFPSCRNAGPSDRFCRIAPTYTNTDYQRDRQMSRETGITTVTIKGDRIVRNPHYGSSRDRGRSRDRTETTGSGGTITYIDGIEVPNDFLAFAEKYPEAAYRKYQHLKHDHLWRATKVFTVANKSIRSSSPPRASQKKGSVSDKVLKVWQQRVGHKVHVHRPYVIGVNVQGDVGVQDPRTGIVYTLFEGSRKHTDAYLPGHYPKQTQDYPAQDIQMGQWILGKYGDYKLTLNKALIREGEDLSCAPMRRVLLEDRTTKAMLATFGIVLNTMGPDKLYQLGKQYSQTNPNSGPAMMEAAQWLYMFRKPEKYFTISLEKPIAVFKGEPLSHENVPSSVVKRWRKSPHFTKNIKGNLAIQDKRNSLTYTILVSDRRYSDDFLPVGYKYSDRDIQLGGWLIERYVDHKIGLHDVLIGNMEDRIHEIFSEPKHRTNTAILSTFGIVANKMGPSGLRKLSVELETSDRDLSRLLFEAHQWLGLFKNPNKYFKLSMEKPIAVFKGERLTHTNVPAHIRRQWWTHEGFETFTNSLAGTSSLQDPRNGLCYPLYSVNYRNPQAMLPKGYRPTEEHQMLGASIIEVSGKNVGPLLENVFGIPPQYSRSLLERRKLKALTDLTLTTGLATQTMLENGRLQGNSGFISPRIKEAAVEQLFDAALETTGVGPKLSTAWDFLETRAPQTASLLQTLFNGVTIPVEVAQSLLRKALRTVGVPPIQAQNLVDSTLLVGGITGGAKALSKLKGQIPKKTVKNFGLGTNPFKGKTPKQIDSMFKRKGFIVKGPNPMLGEGSYFHPQTGRKYYLDKGKKWKKGTELPHVDVHKKGLNETKKRYPLGDSLYE